MSTTCRTPAFSVRAALVCVLGGWLLLAGGCSSSDDLDGAADVLPSTEAAPAAVDSSPVEASEAMAPQFVEAPCPYEVSGLTEGVDLRCGVVEVELRDGSADLVQLAVTIVGSATSMDPIVHLPGGPGASAEAYAPILGSAYRDLAAATGRTIVIVDQRGSGNSEPFLTCDDPSDVGSCVAALVDAGTDPTNFTTAKAADDIADVAAALGATDVNLWGASYGSRLAIEVAHRHPALVRSLVIESVDFGGSPLDDTSDIVAAVERINASCQADGACSDAVADVRSVVNDVASSLEAAPVETSFAPLDPTTFGNLVMSLMEEADGTQFVPAFIAAVRDGDVATIDAFLASSASRPQIGGRFSPAMNAFVNCSDLAPYRVSEPIPAGPADGADLLSGLLWAKTETLYGTGCDGWPGMSDTLTDVDGLEMPTLILNGTDDSNTPLENARHAMSRFENSTLVAFPGFGHFVVHRGGNDCGASIVAAFIGDPLATPDTSCVLDATTPASLPSVADVELVERAVPDLGLSVRMPVGWLPVGTSGFVTADGSVVVQIVPQQLEPTLGLIGDQYGVAIDTAEERDVNGAVWSTLAFPEAGSEVRVAATDIGGSTLILVVSAGDGSATADRLFVDVLSSIRPL